MKTTGKILSSVLIIGGIFASAAPIANAQVTYVYPITTGYPTSYVTPSYPSYTSPYGSSSCITLTNYLTLGSSDATTGGQVTELQQFLSRTGYLNGVTGYFDQGTYGAVVNFQNAHGITPTGTVGPLTSAAINAQSCGLSVSPMPVPTPVNPVAPSSNGCYWQNNVYQCGCPNGYNGSYYNNYPYSNNYCGVQVNSVNAAYNYNGVTLTIQGYGFTSSNNTVYFNNVSYGGLSSNGTSLVVTVPDNYYYSGNYGIYVVNGSGQSSNTLSFSLNSGSNNNYYGNGQVTLGSITGPSSVQAGTTNGWNVTVSGNTNYNNSYYYNNGYYNPNTTLTVSWGDGNSSNTQTVNIGNGQSQNLSFNHTYNYPGTYTINMTANNANGQTSYRTFTVTVYGYSTGYYPY